MGAMSKKSEYNKALANERYSKGLCKICGRRPVLIDRKACSACLKKSVKRTKQYRKKDPKAFKRKYHELKKAGTCTDCRAHPAEVGTLCVSCSLVERQRAVRIKYEVMQIYGGVCKCCGESNVAFLSIDHINNDGGSKRRSGEHKGGGAFYKKLRRAPVDPTLQVLCYNCNFGRRVTGVCPHQDNSYYEAALRKTKYTRHDHPAVNTNYSRSYEPIQPNHH